MSENMNLQKRLKGLVNSCSQFKTIGSMGSKVGRIEYLGDLLREFPDESIESRDENNLKSAIDSAKQAVKNAVPPTGLSVDTDSTDAVSDALQSVITVLEGIIRTRLMEGWVLGTESREASGRRKTGRRVRWAFMVIFGCLAIVAGVFTVWRYHGGPDVPWLPEAIGLFDLVLGIAFAWIEQISDAKKQKIHDEASEAVATGDLEKGKKVTESIVENYGIMGGFLNKQNNNTTTYNYYGSNPSDKDPD